MRLLRLKLAGDIAGNEVHREQLTQVCGLGVFFKGGKVRKGHFLAKFLETLGGNLAVFYKVGIALEDGFGEKLVAGNFDPKLAFKTEYDIEKVDRFRTRVDDGLISSSSTLSASTRVADTFLKISSCVGMAKSSQQKTSATDADLPNLGTPKESPPDPNADPSTIWPIPSSSRNARNKNHLLTTGPRLKPPSTVST